MEKIESPDHPSGNVPLSQGIQHDDLVFVSGNVPVDLDTGDPVGGDITQQTRQTLDNIAAVLEAANLSTDDIAKTTVFLTDRDDFTAFNDAYRDYLNEPYPARSTIVVDLASPDFDIEIEAFAVRE